jgi:hypothetical protein
MKKIAKTAATLGLSALPFLTMASPALAGTINQFNLTPQGQFANLANITLPRLVQSLITLAMVLAAIVAFAFLIYGGIVWITSGGDKAKTESARNTITAALVGLLIVFGAWAIIQLMQMFFGINVLQLNLTPFGS